MSLPAEKFDNFRDVTTSPGTNDDVSRGRKRSRSLSRTARSKSLRPDESSTLRGRSPRRATSPFVLHSRNTSPAALRSSPSHLLLHSQLRRARREHCPSRTASPAERTVRRRQRSRSRGRSRSRKPRRDHEPVRSPDAFSRLRNEILFHQVEGSVASAQS
ncbi:hypothetical protein E4U54_006433 [Claviceps lovelessii]|nr:hypothetical protein E4U54_006433 [Claviceps lovelessii]